MIGHFAIITLWSLLYIAAVGLMFHRTDRSVQLAGLFISLLMLAIGDFLVRDIFQ